MELVENKPEAPKKERTVEQVQQEYTQMCVRAGHTQYQIAQLQKDLALFNDTLRDLNLEAGAIQAKNLAAEAAKKAEAAKAAASKEKEAK